MTRRLTWMWPMGSKLAAVLTCLCLAACSEEQSEAPDAAENETNGQPTASNTPEESDENDTPNDSGNRESNDASSERGNDASTDGANDSSASNDEGSKTPGDSLAGGEWGSIKGTFVLQDDVPEKVVLIEKGAPVRDAEVCSAETLYRNDLVVDPETKGIRHVFIYLRRAPQDMHPEAAKVPEKEFVQDQKGCRFTPHTAFIRCGQTVRIVSGDPIVHNTHGKLFKNQSFNQTIGANDRVGIEKTFPRSESLPMPVGCDFHRHMQCHWLILDHPYAAVTNEKGEFEIKNLPAGEHSFRVWHERAGYLEREWEVSVAADKTTTIEPYEVPLAKLEKGE